MKWKVDTSKVGEGAVLERAKIEALRCIAEQLELTNGYLGSIEEEKFKEKYKEKL